MNKAEVLAALYNNSKPLGMGAFQFEPTAMTLEEADDLLSKTTRFDYLKGRVMKINLSGDTLNTALYNRDNGVYAAEHALYNLDGYVEVESQ